MRTTLVPLSVACGALMVVAWCTGAGGSAADESQADTSSPRASATAPAPVTTPLSGPDAVPVDWPSEAAAERGAEQWAVYLAVGPAGAPELAEATEYLRTRGYSTDEPRELGCDRGAAEALRRSADELAVAVYFDWRADAGDFLGMMKPPGGDPAQFRGFVEMLRVTRDCP
jgi:hypothetical protein